jgi:hypothetical protein
MKVLLMHGLETPADGGFKARLLRKVFGHGNVHCADMRLREFRNIKTSNWMRMLVLYGVVSGAGVLKLVYNCVKTLIRTRSPLSTLLPLLQAVVSAAVAYLGFKKLKQRAVWVMWQRAIAIQRRALMEFRPDVVIGSSFGAGTAVMCLQKGYYRLPTVLWCPAQDAIARASGYDVASIKIPQNVPVIIVHARADQVIPFSHSEALLARSNVDKAVVSLEARDNDDHRLANATNKKNGKQNVLRWVSTVLERDEYLQQGGHIKSPPLL